VGGKVFALTSLERFPAAANLKCDPDLALDLRDQYEQVRPGYHMNKKHWNTVEIDSGIPDAELSRMIDHSYDLVARKPRRASITRHSKRPTPKAFASRQSNAQRSMTKTTR
jgi:predicted DNA-binding protein (MmcQ/YjbR family)